MSLTSAAKPIAMPQPTLPSVLMAGTTALATLVLAVGWLGGFDTMVRFGDGFAAMVPSTALGLILLAAGVLSVMRGAPSRTALATGAAIGVAIITVASFALRLTTPANGLDGALFPVTIGNEGTALATTLLTLGGCVCLWRLGGACRRTDRVFEVVASIGFALSLTAGVGYVFGAEALYGHFLFSSMALPTALAFAMLFTAFLLAAGERTWMRYFVGPGAGSATARRMLPVVVIGPLCFVTLRMVDNGHILASLGYSLITVALLALAVTTVAVNAAVENDAERRATAAVKALDQSKREVELLLAEVHHRVKNNLQQIQSIIQIECRAAEGERSVEQLKALSARIRSIGIVHQLLMTSPTIAEIDLKGFVGELLDAIRASHGLNKRGITIDASIAPCTLPLETAVTMGLLVTELVTNSVKHAFPRTASGRILISFEHAGTTARLTVRDDGVGGATGATDAGKGGGKGIGNTLIVGLVHKLGGNITVTTSEGTTSSIVFDLGADHAR
ncbi:sensor histidine kinase [Acuticoccus mangrovi]|uniref:histidine kinase n=1 Tax=Acuticoccus mangrovi TaxID=2796142 RepID=A0A934MKG5_9HYPH|nr:sensor histidine kinase [Acuticoccus mangrovi]MBJ3775439.1 sensor histidine kinase [Acuticoccus mangrovi]